MKATPSIDFQTVDPTRESLVRFVAMLQKVYRNLALAVNNQILHFNGVPSGNPLVADLAVDDVTGNLYVWFGGAWVLISGGSGGSGGSGIPGIDGLDADEPMMIPGAQGPQGNPGATGPAGPMGLGIDGLDGEDGIGIPGPAGIGAGGAWTLISSQVLGGAVATVTFSSIPGTYNHLKLIINGRTSDVASVVEIQGQFNGDTGGNQYDYHQWRQTNSTTAGSVNLSTKMGFGDLVAASADANTAGSIEVLIPNYAGTTFYKHFISHFSTTPVFNNGTAWVIGTYGGQWRSTAAITSILLFDGSGGNFVTGSAFYLYGIT